MDDNAGCSLCGHRNPSANRFCGRCGASLAAGEQVVPRREESPALAERSLPAKLKPVGKALAVGAAVLAAEATLAWLHRRTVLARLSSLPATRSDTLSVAPGYLIGQSLEEVFVRMRADDRSELFVQRVVRVLRVPEPPEDY